MRLYLASVSPRRRALLKEHAIPYRRVATDYAERMFSGISAKALVRRHALGKALSALARVRNGLILAADTVVCHRGRILGKPKSLSQAARMLRSLEGRRHRVVTGVALLKVDDGRVRKKTVFDVTSLVTLRRFTEAQRTAYLKRIGPLDKAGSYAAQRQKDSVVRKVEGSFSNVVGLPMEKLKKVLSMLDC